MPEVVATTGATFSNDEISLEWTLGEVMTESYVGDILLTQGFHQPSLGLLSSNNDIPDLANYGIHVFPNPSTDHVTVQLPAAARLLGLRNVAGQVTSIRFSGSNDQLSTNASALPAGVYFLRVQLASGRVITNRLIIH